MRGADLWALFVEYRDTPLEFSHAVSKVDDIYLTVPDLNVPLGEAILFETRNLQSIRHLIAQGIDFCDLAFITLFEWYLKCTPDEMYDMLVQLNFAPDLLSDPNSAGWSPNTAVKCAIIGRHYGWLRVMLEYGCKLPRGMSLPDWVVKINMEVIVRKSNCKRATLVLFGIARFRKRSERDTIRLIAQKVKNTWRCDEWTFIP